MRYIGVDLHKTKIAVCYLTDDKYTHKNYKIDEINKFKMSLHLDDELCFEATANSAWFYRQCANLVSKAIVIDTFKFKMISSSHSKTDKNDAKSLAFHLSKGLAPATNIKNETQQDLQSLFNTRKVLVKQRTMLKNEIHGYLLAHGVIIKSSELCSKVGLDRVSRIVINPLAQANLTVLIEAIKTINIQIKSLDTSLEEFGKILPGFLNLSSIDGLGSNTVIMLLATIGDINNFASYKHLCSYLGLVPIVKNSNETIRHGGITKKGNAALRGNLVQCAMVAITKNNRLNNFYQKLHASKGHGKAIVATARKLVQLIYFTLKYSWFFEHPINTGTTNEALIDNSPIISKDTVRTILEINWTKQVA